MCSVLHFESFVLLAPCMSILMMKSIRHIDRSESYKIRPTQNSKKLQDYINTTVLIFRLLSVIVGIVCLSAFSTVLLM